jgi:hypothetical protein
VQSDGTLTLVDLLGKNALEYVLGYSLRLLDARLEYDLFLAEKSSERPRFYNIYDSTPARINDPFSLTGSIGIYQYIVHT